MYYSVQVYFYVFAFVTRLTPVAPTGEAVHTSASGDLLLPRGQSRTGVRWLWNSA